MPLGFEKDLQRRTRILSVTRRLVSERGYSNVTLGDIAKASGVTVQTLYNRFNSKDELLASAVAEYYQLVIGKAERAARGNGITKLLDIIDTITDELSKERDYAREMSNIFTHLADVGVSTRAAIAMLRDSMFPLLVEMRENGQLVEWIAPDTAFSHILWHISGVMRNWSLGGLSVTGFQRNMARGTCLILLGIARGEARDALEARMRRLHEEQPHTDVA